MYTTILDSVTGTNVSVWGMYVSDITVTLIGGPYEGATAVVSDDVVAIKIKHPFIDYTFDNPFEPVYCIYKRSLEHPDTAFYDDSQ